MRTLNLLLLTLFLGLPGVSTADTLLLDLIQQQPSTETLPRPVRGQTMDQVRLQFGPPPEQLPPVGDPPITRWRYTPFTVYFEGDRVIDSVINH